MTSKQYRVELQGDESGLLATLRTTEAALGANERAYGTLAQQMARVGTASTAFISAQQAQVVALRSVADGERALQSIRAAAGKRDQAGQEFVADLQRQAESIGKTRSELLALQAAQLGVSQQAAPLIQRLQQGEKGLQGFARSGKLAAHEIQQVGFQLNDFAVQVASGQSPITALVQQGSQLSGTFGGIRPALAALRSLITPTVVGVGALAAGVGVLGFAYTQGYRESRQLNDSLVITGNYAGVTAGQVDRMARSIASLNARPIGDVREALAGVVGSGKFGPQNIEAVTTAVVTLQKFTGGATEDIVKQFAGIGNGVAKWAAEQNKAYNFLTPKVYEQIRALEAQGRTQEAVGVAVGALNDKFAGQTRNLGFLETAYESAKRAASGFWDFLKGIGRDTTVEDRIAQITAALAAPVSPEESNSGGVYEAALRAELEALQASKRAREDKAANDAQTAEANQKAREKAGEAHQGALAAGERAGAQQRLAQAEAAHDREFSSLRDSYDKESLSADGFIKGRVAIESQLIAAKERALAAEIDIENRRSVVGNETQGAAKDARIVALETRRIALARERASLADKAKRGELGPGEDKPNAIRQGDDANAKRREEFAAREQVALDRADEAARLSAKGRAETNRDLAVQLITDDRARGQAQIAIEAATMRERIDLEQLAGEERKAAEDAVATYIALRNQQLTEQLKPEWQKQLEAWQDTTRLMREAHASFIGGFIQTGEQAWLKFIETGKLSLSNFGTLIRDELARLTYRQFVAPAVANIGKTIAGAIGIKIPGAAAAGGDLAQQAARKLETDAVVSNTVALKALELTGVSPANGALAQLATAAYGASAALAQVSGGQAASGLSGLIGDFFGSGGGGDGTGIGLPGIGDGGGMPFPFAKGGAFSHGMAPERFAKGGEFTNRVISSPTRFLYAGGRHLGEMGEAGPESVMPLRRTPSGDLGVIATAGQAPVVNLQVTVVNNHPQAKVRTEQQPGGGLRVFVDQIESELGSRIDGGVGLARNVGGRFALNSGAALIR